MCTGKLAECSKGYEKLHSEDEIWGYLEITGKAGDIGADKSQP